MSSEPQAGRPALKWGLVFGAILIVISLASTGIQVATGTYSQLGDPVAAQANLGTNLLIGCAAFLLELGAYFLAGMLAAKANGKVGTGSFAGLIAGAMSGIVGAIVSFVIFSTVKMSVPAAANMDPAQYQSFMRIATSVGAVIGILIALGIGAGMGALGGLVGRSQYESSHPAPLMQPSYYMPMGTPGYPPAGAPGAYPPPPGYPPAGAPGAYPPTTGNYPPSPNTDQTPQTPEQPQ